MALKDWIGLGAEGLDWWQSRANYKDAQQAIDKGLDTARGDITKWQQPYADFGNRQMQGYEGLGQFDFQFDQSDPSYQWRFGQGQQAVLRSQAGQKAIASGNTATRLQTQGQNMASQEYQAEFDRDLKAYDANRDYYQFGTKLGAETAQNMGNNLADISMMAGANKASLYNSMSQLNSKTIGNVADALIGQGGPSGVVGDAMNVAKSMGLEGADAISWVANKVGMGTDAVMGIVTGAANQVAGATWGLFGAGPQTLGGASAATAGGGTATAAGGATSGAAGFGATLAAASPLLAFGGIIALNELLGSSRDVDKNIKKIQTSSDPLATIAGMDSSDLDALFARDGSKIDVSYGVSSQQKRGTMYAMILNTLPEEQLSEIRQRDDLSTIANDLFQSALSGRGLHAKLGEVGNVNSGEALAKLFPTIDPAQFTQLQNLSNRVRSATAYNNDYAGDFNGMTRTPQYVPTEELNALKTALYSQMQTELASYQNQSTARSMLVA